MANYESFYRTNYFKVTDEARYKKLIGNLDGEELNFFEKDGLHAFGGYGNLTYYDVITVADFLKVKEQIEDLPLKFYQKEDSCSDNWVEVTKTPEEISDYYVEKTKAHDTYMEVRITDDFYDTCYDNEDFDVFLEEMQKILPDGEAMIYTEVGHENLRYVSGYATIVTNKEIRCLDLTSYALETAKEMLGTDFKTQMDY